MFGRFFKYNILHKATSSWNCSISIRAVKNQIDAVEMYLFQNPNSCENASEYK